jgi:hypothetical protein
MGEYHISSLQTSPPGLILYSRFGFPIAIGSDTRVKGKSFWFLQKIWNNGVVPLPAEIAQTFKIIYLKT